MKPAPDSLADHSWEGLDSLVSTTDSFSTVVGGTNAPSMQNAAELGRGLSSSFEFLNHDDVRPEDSISQIGVQDREVRQITRAQQSARTSTSAHGAARICRSGESLRCSLKCRDPRLAR